MNPTIDLDIENTNIRVERAKTGKTEVFKDNEVELITKYIFEHYLEFQPIVSLALLLNFQLGLRVGDESGKHVLRERYNEILEHYCKKVSIPVKSIHKTRKTVLSRLFKNGFGLDEVMEISGHRDKATLVKHYLFSTEDEDKQRKKFSNALSLGINF